MIKEGDHVIFKKGDYMKIFPVKINKYNFVLVNNY
jgi:hypothetical protein